MTAKRGGRKPGSTNASASDIERGLSAWLRCGTSDKAAQETGINAGTIQGWRVKHPETWLRLEAAHARAREEAIRCAGAALADDVTLARETLRRAMDGSGPLVPKEAIMAAREVFNALGIVDRIGRLDRSQPTEITEDRRTDAELKRDLARHLADMNIPVPAELTQ